MKDSPDFLEFVYLPEFERQAKGMFTEDNREELEARLTENPEAGAVVAGTAGMRKIRVALEGRGRRGGARVIYYYRSTKGRLYMITIYAKNEAESLSERGKRTLRQIAAAIEQEP